MKGIRWSVGQDQGCRQQDKKQSSTKSSTVARSFNEKSGFVKLRKRSLSALSALRVLFERQNKRVAMVHARFAERSRAEGWIIKSSIAKMKGIFPPPPPPPQRHQKKMRYQAFCKETFYLPFFPVGMSGSWGYAKTERAHGPPFLLPRVSEHRALGPSDPALFMRPVLCSLCFNSSPQPITFRSCAFAQSGTQETEFHRVNQTTEPTFLCTTP